MFKIRNLAWAVFGVLLMACSSAQSGGGTGDADSSGGTGTGGASPGATGTGGASPGATDAGAGCAAYQVPAGTDLQAPAVLLKRDVMTVFNNNCGSAACHGSVMGSKGELFLGALGVKKADASVVRTGLVGHASGELSSMPYVTAGNPSKSFLMHKMDGDQCQFDAQCTGGDCLAEMPSGLGHVLPAATRDIVRRWIAQGAKDN